MEKGLEIKEKVKSQLEKYALLDNVRLEEVKKMIEKKGTQWDKDVITMDGYKIENLTLLLIYEYCVATERLTGGRINFEKTLYKLSQIDKFRLGEPKQGDAIVIYGKSVDDPNAMSILSDEYDNVRRTTGAQYTDYVGEDGKLKSAVFIFGKKLLNDGKYTEGMNFWDLNEIRHTAFHEWNHNAEQEKIEIDSLGYSNEFQRRYKSVDGKTYTNYKAVTQYRLPIFKRGVFTRMSELFEIKPCERIGISEGLSTREEFPKETIMHNQVTEGFVELYARQMVWAIESDAKLDERKYYEHTEMARRINDARDGKFNIGKTAADFLSHSIVLKNELENKIVDDKKDGLHYFGDYADAVMAGKTKKQSIVRKFNKIAKKINLNWMQIMNIKNNSFWDKNKFSLKDIEDIKKVFKEYLDVSDCDNEMYLQVNEMLDSYVETVIKENNFFDSIPDKLGYIRLEKNEQNLDDSDEAFEI